MNANKYDEELLDFLEDVCDEDDDILAIIVDIKEDL